MRRMEGTVMRMRKSGATAFFATTVAAVAMMAAPIAAADTCDPAVTICQGGDVQTGDAPASFAPQVSAADDQYPNDEDWYFNPAGGGTALQPEHPASAGGGGETGGGGGHH